MSFFAQTCRNVLDWVSTIPKMNLLASWLTLFPGQGATVQLCFALKTKANLSTWVQAPRVCLYGAPVKHLGAALFQAKISHAQTASLMLEKNISGCTKCSQRKQDRSNRDGLNSKGFILLGTNLTKE